jgi:cysteine-rich repeat protein
VDNTWVYFMISVQKAGSDTVVCLSFEATAGKSSCLTYANKLFADAADNVLVLKGSASRLNKLEFWNVPMSIKDMNCKYDAGAGKCADSGDGTFPTCGSCPAGGSCVSNCAAATYGNGGACTACIDTCRSCFGAEAIECFACTAVSAIDFDYVNTCNKCGDGHRRGVDEECDDGNVDKGDGCSDICKIETGWKCDGKDPDKCTFNCIIGTNEHGTTREKPCDDDNTIGEDGCTTYCFLNKGYVCAGGDVSTKDACSEVCGDGVRWT